MPRKKQPPDLSKLSTRLAEYEKMIALFESQGYWDDAKDLQSHINSITGTHIENDWSRRWQAKRKPKT